jgi:transcriptional regulator with XRE-family HTH domain
MTATKRDYQLFSLRFQLMALENYSTDEEIAEALAVPKDTVLQWRTGMELPESYLLADLANFFQVSFHQLVKGIDAFSPTGIAVTKDNDFDMDPNEMLGKRRRKRD